MKKFLSLFALFLFLISSACLAPRHNRLIRLTSNQLPDETQIVLSLSSPVEFREIQLDHSPFILLDFTSRNVYSQENKEIVFDAGSVKTIKNIFSQKDNKDTQLLNFVLIELTRELPYTISRQEDSLCVTIQNAPQARYTQDLTSSEIEPAAGAQDLDTQQTEGYLIGPGDILEIEVWRNPETSREVTVNFRGEITLPPIKNAFKVEGYSVPFLEEALTDALSKYLIEPVVFVTIKEYNSQRITVLGEAISGMYTLKRRTSLIEFLGEIGGTAKTADISRTKLIKKNGDMQVYDLEKLLLNPQQGQNPILEGGDTIYIPPLKYDKVYILGEVKNPKSIAVQGKISLVDALTEAGGFTVYAIRRSIVIIRGEVGSQKGTLVDFDRLRKEADLSQNVELQPGDIVYVPKSFVENIERFMRVMFNPLFWSLSYLTR